MSDTPTHSRIKNENGQFRSAVGPHAVEAYRLKCMITALDFKRKTGMEITRGVRILKLARQTTGLATNDYGKLTAALQIMFNALLDQCEVSTSGTVTK